MEMEKLVMRLQEVADAAHRNKARIEKLEKDNSVIHNLASSVAVLAEQMKSMAGNVSVLTKEVEDMKEKPAKRWDSLVDKIVWAVAAALIGFALAKIGL